MGPGGSRWVQEVGTIFLNLVRNKRYTMKHQRKSAVKYFAIRYTLPENMQKKEYTEKSEFANLISNFKKLLQELDVKQYIFQLEASRDIHDEKGANYHLQGFISTILKVRPSILHKKANDSEFAGTYIEPSACKDSVMAYSMKNTTRIDGPWTDQDDVVKYNGNDLPSELLSWQKSLENYIEGPVDDRKIIWIWDPEGASGKSKFCKLMDYKNNTITIGYSDSKDAMYVVSKNPGKRCYFFDLTRTKPKMFSNADIYSSLEMVKNGHFLNVKYESNIVIMDVPHVCVFSNNLPNLSAISMDRWSVYRLMNGYPVLIQGQGVLTPEGCENLHMIPKRSVSTNQYLDPWKAKIPNEYIDAEKQRQNLEKLKLNDEGNIYTYRKRSGMGSG